MYLENNNLKKNLKAENRSFQKMNSEHSIKYQGVFISTKKTRVNPQPARLNREHSVKKIL